MEWGGGLDFLRMIAGSLLAADPTIELHFLFPDAGPRYRIHAQLRRFKKTIYKVLGKSYERNPSPTRLYLDDLVFSAEGKSYVHHIDMGMSALRQAANKYQLDILLPSIRPLSGQTVPWIGYLYDYQHAYYPNFFSHGEIRCRNIRFREMLFSAQHVMVNARAVSDDIKHFNPDHRAEIVTLPFAAAPNPKWLELEPIDLIKYGITNPYFIISNQFWQHKDHTTAWRAFALVLNQNPNIQLVCTGETHDYRNPDYFDGLIELAKELGIIQRIKILGLIRKEEQIQLMRHAVAMIQPTLFEGGAGGGAVYDAVSLDVLCIVSDIKVNLELNEDCIHFFEARNPTSLAGIMLRCLSDNPTRIRVPPAKLISRGVERREKCGKVIINLIENILKN